MVNCEIRKYINVNAKKTQAFSRAALYRTIIGFKLPSVNARCAVTKNFKIALQNS